MYTYMSPAQDTIHVQLPVYIYFDTPSNQRWPVHSHTHRSSLALSQSYMHDSVGWLFGWLVETFIY